MADVQVNAQVKIATREAYGKALAELGKQNLNVVALDADLAKSTKSAVFAKEFPDRFFDIGISEQDMVATAGGLGVSGKIPFASTFAVFATGRAYDQIRVSVAYSNSNAKIVGSHAGLATGEDGASHQATEDIALMRVMPNMRVAVPADGTETRSVVMKSAEYSGPVYIRTCRSGTPLIYDDSYSFEFGRASKLREGDDVSIIACGVEVFEALTASDLLKEKGINAAVVNMASIKPIDEAAIIAEAKRCGAIVTAEDHSIIGGLGGAVAEVLTSNYPVPQERIGVKDTFAESAKPAELLEKYGLSAPHIVAACEKVIKRKG